MTTNKQLTLPGATVKKSNELVRSKLRLNNVYAARVFTTIASCIKESDADFQEYTFPASAFIDPNDKGGKAYDLIRKSLKNITGYAVELPLPIEDEQDEKEPPYMIIPLFAYAHYRKGKVTVQVHPKLKPQFIALATHFTSYNLLEYIKLSGTYSQRIFEILNSYVKTNTTKEISVPELQRMLNTPESMNRYPDFKRYVLERAHKEITEKTDLEYEWEPIKTGRTVTAIEFIFSKRAKEEAQKKQAEKERNSLNKYVQKAVECFKEKGGKEYLVKGKCPSAKPKTKMCSACKRMEYFSI